MVAIPWEFHNILAASERKGCEDDMAKTYKDLLSEVKKEINEISVDVALAAASNPTDFKTKLALEGGDPDAVATEEKVMGPMEIESDERF